MTIRLFDCSRLPQGTDGISASAGITNSGSTLTVPAYNRLEASDSASWTQRRIKFKGSGPVTLSLSISPTLMEVNVRANGQIDVSGTVGANNFTILHTFPSTIVYAAGDTLEARWLPQTNGTDFKLEVLLNDTVLLPAPALRQEILSGSVALVAWDAAGYIADEVGFADEAFPAPSTGVAPVISDITAVANGQDVTVTAKVTQNPTSVTAQLVSATDTIGPSAMSLVANSTDTYRFVFTNVKPGTYVSKVAAANPTATLGYVDGASVSISGLGGQVPLPLVTDPPVITSATSSRIQGTGIAGATVTVLVGSRTPATVVVAGNLAWELTLNGLAVGSYDVTATQQKSGESASTVSNTMTFVVGNAAPPPAGLLAPKGISLTPQYSATATNNSFTDADGKISLCIRGNSAGAVAAQIIASVSGFPQASKLVKFKLTSTRTPVKPTPTPTPAPTPGGAPVPSPAPTPAPTPAPIYRLVAAPTEQEVSAQGTATVVFTLYDDTYSPPRAVSGVPLSIKTPDPTQFNYSVTGQPEGVTDVNGKVTVRVSKTTSGTVDTSSVEASLFTYSAVTAIAYFSFAYVQVPTTFDVYSENDFILVNHSQKISFKVTARDQRGNKMQNIPVTVTALPSSNGASPIKLSSSLNSVYTNTATANTGTDGVTFYIESASPLGGPTVDFAVQVSLPSGFTGQANHVGSIQGTATTPVNILYSPNPVAVANHQNTLDVVLTAVNASGQPISNLRAEVSQATKDFHATTAIVGNAVTNALGQITVRLTPSNSALTASVQDLMYTFFYYTTGSFADRIAFQSTQLISIGASDPGFGVGVGVGVGVSGGDKNRPPTGIGEA